MNRNISDIKMPVGISDFEEIRRGGYYFVDKSALIREVLRAASAQVMLLTRPRRFGKTIAMSMLASFFDIRKDSKSFFQDLEIMNDGDVVKEWMNQSPTLFLSFKDVEGTRFENAFGLLRFTIAQLCITHDYLGDSSRVSEEHKKIFARLKNQTGSLTDIQGSLLVLMKMMQAHYGKPVILLLDEYDVPVAKASSHGYYAEMLETIRVIMSTALKDNSALKFAIITGCLKIAKESIFTGTNNLVSDTISSTRLNEYFGFMQGEVDRLLEATGLETHAESIKAWYDGYHFGDFDIYCPWDVMNYVRDLQHDPKAAPASYWKNTSGNEIIRSFIDYAGSTINRKLEILLAGGYVIQKIEEDLTYDYLHSSEDNLWSILYLTGYLTKIRTCDLVEELKRGEEALVIPNAEVREIFETTIKKWFDDSAKKWDRKLLFDAVWSGDEEKITSEMNYLLRRTISYHDYREDFYHAFLAGIFAGAGYAVESNREYGEGRADIVVYDMDEARVAVFEAKYTNMQEEMEKKVQEAVRQIDKRMYAKTFEEEYDHVFCYGIAFFKKRCLVRKK